MCYRLYQCSCFVSIVTTKIRWYFPEKTVRVCKRKLRHVHLVAHFLHLSFNPGCGGFGVYPKDTAHKTVIPTGYTSLLLRPSFMLGIFRTVPLFFKKAHKL